MGSYIYRTNYYETDYWSLIPTGHLLRLAMHAITLQTDAEGLAPERIRGELGALWMLARARFYQYAPIRSERDLELRVSGRSIDRGTYARAIDFFDAGEKLARCELASVAVNISERRILRPRVVEDFWEHSEPPENNVCVPRLKLRAELPKIKDYTVSPRDCDYNRHFNSSNYIDFVSELAGFYEGGPKILEYLQIDYNSEALPGQRLSLEGELNGATGSIKGVHEGGSVCFAAEYKMRGVDI